MPTVLPSRTRSRNCSTISITSRITRSSSTLPSCCRPSRWFASARARVEDCNPQSSSGDMMQKIFVTALACILGVLAGGAAPAAHAQTPTAAPAPAAQGATSPDYVIGPGDEIEVFVWQNRDLSVTVPVRPDGKISTPLDEDMVAVGKTPTQLAHDIE